MDQLIEPQREIVATAEDRASIPRRRRRSSQTPPAAERALADAALDLAQIPR